MEDPLQRLWPEYDTFQFSRKLIYYFCAWLDLEDHEMPEDFGQFKSLIVQCHQDKKACGKFEEWVGRYHDMVNSNVENCICEGHHTELI